MAYDRYDSRRGAGDQPRFSDDRWRDRDRGSRDERGFFERAGEQIASWFGDDDDEDRRRGSDDRFGRERDFGRDRDFGRERGFDRGFGPERGFDRGFGRERGRFGFDRDEERGRSWRDREPWGAGDREDRGYRPVTGDYGRSEGLFAASGFGRGRPEGDWDRTRFDRPESHWDRDDYRRTSFAGSAERSHHDPHYQQWRQRQIEELDRDYEEYRREHQSKFENDFGNWRATRQSKRQMLGQIREHMEVVGSDEEHVGTVDRIAGDRIILTKSDSPGGEAHHSLSCTDIARIDGDRVILEVSAKQARAHWRDESRERALFEREDQGEAGPHALERSFSGTYRE